MNKKGNIILWLTVAGVIVGLIGVYFGYRNDRNQLGGSMNATYQTRLLNNGETKTIVVCLEDNDISLNELTLTPAFENPYRYSLKDFSLSFEAECTNVSLTPSSFFDEHKRGENKWLYSYSKGVLASFNETQSPFSCIQLNGSKGHCFIKSKASYNGIHSAFEYYTNVYFFVVPNRNNLPFDQWTKICEEMIPGQLRVNSCDVYFCAKNHQPKYKFDVSFGGINHPTHEEKEDRTNQNNDNVPAFTKSADLDIFDLGIAQCSISRTDTLLRFDLTFCNDIDYGWYLVEGRYKDSRFSDEYQYLHGIIYANELTKTTWFSYIYKNGAIPVIDKVSLYPQSLKEDVISIEQKRNTYRIKNKTESTIICYIQYSNNSGTIIGLDGGEKKRFKNIGVSPIQVYKTDRKGAEKAYGFLPVWAIVILAFILLGIIITIIDYLTSA